MNVHRVAVRVVMRHGIVKIIVNLIFYVCQIVGWIASLIAVLVVMMMVIVDIGANGSVQMRENFSVGGAKLIVLLCVQTAKISVITQRAAVERNAPVQFVTAGVKAHIAGGFISKIFC